MVHSPTNYTGTVDDNVDDDHIGPYCDDSNNRNKEMQCDALLRTPRQNKIKFLREHGIMNPHTARGGWSGNVSIDDINDALYTHFGVAKTAAPSAGFLHSVVGNARRAAKAAQHVPAKSASLLMQLLYGGENSHLSVGAYQGPMSGDGKSTHSTRLQYANFPNAYNFLWQQIGWMWLWMLLAILGTCGLLCNSWSTSMQHILTNAESSDTEFWKGTMAFLFPSAANDSFVTTVLNFILNFTVYMCVFAVFSWLSLMAVLASKINWEDWYNIFIWVCCLSIFWILPLHYVIYHQPCIVMYTGPSSVSYELISKAKCPRNHDNARVRSDTWEPDGVFWSMRDTKQETRWVTLPTQLSDMLSQKYDNLNQKAGSDLKVQLDLDNTELKNLMQQHFKTLELKAYYATITPDNAFAKFESPNAHIELHRYENRYKETLQQPTLDAKMLKYLVTKWQGNNEAEYNKFTVYLYNLWTATATSDNDEKGGETSEKICLCVTFVFNCLVLLSHYKDKRRQQMQKEDRQRQRVQQTAVQDTTDTETSNSFALPDFARVACLLLVCSFFDLLRNFVEQDELNWTNVCGDYIFNFAIFWLFASHLWAISRK